MSEHGESLTPAEALRLQHLAGNQAVLRLLRGLRRTAAESSVPESGSQAEIPEPSARQVEQENIESAAKGTDGQKQSCLTEPRTQRSRASGDSNKPSLAPTRRRKEPSPKWLLQAAERARRDGAEDIATAMEEIARRLGELNAKNRTRPAAPALRMLQAAARIVQTAHPSWACGSWLRRWWSWLCWMTTFGHRGGPWLSLTAVAYARVPCWRRKDAAFVAEIIFRATGVIHQARRSYVERGCWHPFRPLDWSNIRIAIPSFEPVNEPVSGDVWVEGERAGVVLGGTAEVWLGLAPEASPGEHWSVGAGLVLVRLQSGACYRRYTGAN